MNGRYDDQLDFKDHIFSTVCIAAVLTSKLCGLIFGKPFDWLYGILEAAGGSRRPPIR